MKRKENVEISFAGMKEPANEVEKETPMVESTPEEAIAVDIATAIIPEEQLVSEDEAEDAYATAVESLFNGYQTFQEGMKSLTKFQNPALLHSKLIPVLDGFKAAISEFRASEFVVGTAFEAGHTHLLNGIDKYDVFLVEYPEVLSTATPKKQIKKALKRVNDLGKMSAEADREMKNAFSEFAKAVGEA